MKRARTTAFYSYDAMDRVTSSQYPNTETVYQTYNAASQLTGVAGWNTYASGMTYNALGQPTQMTYGTYGNGTLLRLPLMGSNIPLGIQYWLNFFSGSSTDAAFLLSRLNQPAARQMLLYHYTVPAGATGQADPLRATFTADLAAVGDYPSQPRRWRSPTGAARVPTRVSTPE